MLGPLTIVDSSVLIEHLRGNEEATRFLEERKEQGIVLAPAIVAWELWKGARTRRHREAVARLLESIEVGPFMPAMAALAGEVHHEHRHAGITRPAFDLLIASWALHHEAPLATLDRDYDTVQGLQIVRVPQQTGRQGRPKRT